MVGDEKPSGASGATKQTSSSPRGSASAGGEGGDVMVPEFQPGASSQAPQDKEALAKKEEEIAKAEEAEMQAAQEDEDAEGLLGHMKRGSDR